MLPTLKPNQEIIVSNLPYLFFEPKVNELIAFKNGDQFIIKRINKAKAGEYFVKGDNEKDSKDFGWIERKKIIGKVIYIPA